MKEIRWNDNWLFWVDHDSFALIWDVPKEAKEVSLPHDAMLIEKAKLDSFNGKNTGYRDGDCYIYRKEFYVSQEEKDQVHILKFEGVYMNAFVYINGQLCAKSPFGYSTFYAYLDSYLNYDAINEIRVQVRSGAMTNSRWYSGAGIYRDVYLLTSDLVHFVPDGIRIHTDSIDDRDALLIIESDIINESSNRVQLVLENTIYDHQQVVGKEKSILSLAKHEKTTIRQRVFVRDITCWDENNPYLYECHTALYVKEDPSTLIDTSDQRTGIRILQVDPKHGFRVNHREIKLRGACIHHDSGILGAATYDEVQYRQVRLLKEAGFNAIRMAHQPAASSLLRACDELGMYVMDEYTDVWNRMKSFYDYGLYFDEWWKEDVSAMVRKDYNHPSVILYSIGNEIPEIGTDQGSKVCHDLNELFKKLDSTRFTLASINGVFAAGDSIEEIMDDFKEYIHTPPSIGNVNTFMALMGQHMDQIVMHPAITRKLDKAVSQCDIAGYNYMRARYRKDHEDYPNRVIVGSETYPASIAANWKDVLELSHVIGDFTWTGWDYLGEAGGGIPKYKGQPRVIDKTHLPQTAYGGDLNLIGIRQPVSYYRSIVFGLESTPYIAVQDPSHYSDTLLKSPWMLTDCTHNWNFSGYEDHPIKVEVYAKGEEVELYCNDTLVAKKKIGEEIPYLVSFDTIYQPGKLEAISYQEGKEIGRSTLYTANNARRIRLEQEKQCYQYHLENHIEIVKVTVEDSLGHIGYDDCSEIEVEVEGCELLGFGSGNPMPTHNFTESITTLHQGSALVIVKKTSESSQVKVKYQDTSETIPF